MTIYRLKGRFIINLIIGFFGIHFGLTLFGVSSDLVRLSGSKFESGDANDLTAEQMGWIMGRAKALLDWLKSVEARAAETLGRGENVPGWKLVEGRSIRKWKDERDAEVALLTEFTIDFQPDRTLIWMADFVGRYQFRAGRRGLE